MVTRAEQIGLRCTVVVDKLAKGGSSVSYEIADYVAITKTNAPAEAATSPGRDLQSGETKGIKNARHDRQNRQG